MKNPIFEFIIEFFWKREGLILSGFYLFFAPVVYGTVRIIPNDIAKESTLSVWTLFLVAGLIWIVNRLIKKQVAKNPQNEKTIGIDKKDFLDQYGLITLKHLLKEKEQTLISGDKVIIYTTRLDTENCKIEEDGEMLDVQEIVENNISKGVEYNILFYQEGAKCDIGRLQKTYKNVKKLFYENGLDCELSKDERTGFDLIFYYRHSTQSIEAFFCVNYFVEEPVGCRFPDCQNHCKDQGGQRNNNNLLYKKLQIRLATILYNKLSRVIDDASVNVAVPENRPEKPHTENPLQIWILLGTIFLYLIVPTISNYYIFKDVFGGMIVIDVFFCFLLYLIIVFSVVIQNVRNWTRFFNIKKLLKDYRLTSEKEMNKTERKFGNQIRTQSPNGNTEVWVFSHDLSTEVLGDQSQKIVKRNIGKGVRYVEFYYDHERNRNYTINNMNKFKTNLKTKFRDAVTFVPLRSSENSLDILPFLLGSISFHKDCSHEGCFEHEMKSFFSLRGGEKAEPVYFNMPSCMSKAYFKYFFDRKEKFTNPQPPN